MNEPPRARLRYLKQDDIFTRIICCSANSVEGAALDKIMPRITVVMPTLEPSHFVHHVPELVSLHCSAIARASRCLALAR